ncbi:MAG TPA: GNAT family N-acetyltransferase [Thermoanaerobaculia bacterium]|nr:GNAT family N-acetyltransferase [Thermoanaerobaculia bacterium]
MSDIDYQPVRLAHTDAGRLQLLLDRCSDYYELHEGCTTPADAGTHELTAVPAGRAVGELHLLGLQSCAGTLEAFLQMLPHHPTTDVWWIGFLVVAPELRGGGLGRVLLDHAGESAAAAGASELQLAVSRRNPRAQKFWLAAGFRETGRVCDVIARNGHVDTVCIMSRLTA